MDSAYLKHCKNLTQLTLIPEDVEPLCAGESHPRHFEEKRLTAGGRGQLFHLLLPPAKQTLQLTILRSRGSRLGGVASSFTCSSHLQNRHSN
jgi:hypothetical protein